MLLKLTLCPEGGAIGKMVHPLGNINEFGNLPFRFEYSVFTSQYFDLMVAGGVTKIIQINPLVTLNIWNVNLATICQDILIWSKIVDRQIALFTLYCQQGKCSM